MYTSGGTTQERSLADDPTLFDGKYTILTKLREGGMGAIYKVHHNLLDEIRVIKFMRPAVASDRDLHRRFLQEAKLVTRFKHPNIAAVYDFAIDDDETAYIVMEYVDGLNVFDVFHALHPLGIAFVLEIAEQTLAALGYLHRKNVVHRDISPDNIMVAVDGDAVTVKLIDLGIAKALDANDGVTKTGYFLGKLKYASPEQLGALDAAERLDGRSDLYSFGVVLYELLTGQLPFSGTSSHALITGHLCDAPAPFEITDPEHRVPDAVRALILKSLAKNREERFASAEEMIAAIREIRRHLPAEPFLADVGRLRELHLQTQLQVASQPATTSAQERMNRRFDVRRATPHPAGEPRPASVDRVEEATLPRTVEARRQKTAPAPEIAGAVTTLEPTVAVAPSRARRPWMMAAAATFVAIAVAGAVIVTRNDTASPARVATATATTTPPQPLPEARTETTVTAAAETDVEPLAASTGNEDRDALRREAQEARLLTAAARSNAVARNADRLPVFRAGADALREGEALAAQGDFGPAIGKFAEASRHFAEAEAAARRRSAEPPVQPAAPERREAPAEAVTRLTAPAGRIAEAERTPPPAPAPLEVAPERPPERGVARTDEDAVRAAVAEFVRAQEALDAGRYVAVFPSADRSRIASAFESFRSQELDLAIDSIAVEGDRAVVRARETRVAVPRVGNVQRLRASRTITLERSGSRWIVASIQ